MSFWEFVASIVSSLAWPAVAAWFVWLMRTQLRAFLTSIKRATFEGAGVKVGVERGLTEAEFELTRIESAVAARDVATFGTAPHGSGDPLTSEVYGPAPLDDLRELAFKNPSGAILAAYERMWRALLVSDLTDLRPGRNRIGPPAPKVAEHAVERGILPPGTEKIVADLSLTRNLVAHAEEQPDAEQANRYLSIAARVIDLLNFGLALRGVADEREANQ